MVKIRSVSEIKRAKTIKREIFTVLALILYMTLEAFAIEYLYKPVGVVTGGLTGIGMLLNYASGGVIPSWSVIVVLNIPLLVLAFHKLHLRFTLYTTFTTIYFSVILAVIETFFPYDPESALSQLDPLLLVVFGAVVLGAMGALTIRLGSSTGGLDIVSVLLNKKYSFPMGTISMVINVVIACVLGLVIRDIEVVALSIVGLFVCSVAFNGILQGMNRTKTLFIISDKWDEFAGEVLKEVHRGITLIPCKGAYTHKDKTLVYIIARTMELASIRSIVLHHDEKAIISIIDTREVIGKGFTAVN
ncbi:MAG: YitT family protein [Clostridia bacterium]|nr:YitT family protein [Clostridia bacterium]